MSRRLSRPAVKIFLLLVFIRFRADRTTETPLAFDRRLLRCGAAAPQLLKVKSQLPRELELGLAQGLQRNKWQGPVFGGKDAVYAGCGP